MLGNKKNHWTLILHSSPFWETISKLNVKVINEMSLEKLNPLLSKFHFSLKPL